MQVFKYTAKGIREINEDFLLNDFYSPSESLHLLADGMGGYSFGEVASSLTCKTISDYLSKNLLSDNIPACIKQSVDIANSIIHKKKIELGSKLGTTIAGAYITGNTAYLFWLGDVRIYLFRQSKVIFQTEDHSLINDMRKQGTVSPLDINRYKNIVTRSITGASHQDELPVIETSFNPGDTLILCSDGMWQSWNIASIFNLSDEELNKLFSEKESSNDDNYSIIKIGI
ncbi:MAG: serine/threonine-protein phosphatase [Prolixibacteraceae bacterium]|nr:serine/threonine-protein phosphatase [Prolixibacteraceae bacterium]